MVLDQCSECKKEVSSEAEVCPHCGVKYPVLSFPDNLIGAVISVMINFLNFLAYGALGLMGATLGIFVIIIIVGSMFSE